MAQPPIRPAQTGIPPKPTTPAAPSAVPRPNPLHGATSPASPEGTTDATRMQLNIHGQPPQPDMAPPPPDAGELSDNTQAEMEAGKQALDLNKARQNAELEAGKKAIARLNPNSQSKDGDE